MNRRAAGLLLHPTSLLRDGRGLAEDARPALAWASRAGFSVWQVLPVGPPGHAGSPYDAQSVFAGDPSWFPVHAGRSGYDAFVAAQASWLDDWCLYAALKERYRGAPWISWDEPLRRREPAALADAAATLSRDLERHRRAQFAFETGWSTLRAEAREAGISLLGDVPIYPALDSADVWAHQDLFHLDELGAPTKVAGVPPDYFTDTGQLWGNPIYRWDRAQETGFAWWISRLKRGLELHDVLRLDHFRGFAGYWAVPAGSETAEPGAWEPGPGGALFETVLHALGSLPLVAEDLGHITEDVVALRKAFGLPGMRVLQFAFGPADGGHAPHRLTRDTVVYTGTHDNDTTHGWFVSLDDDARRRVLDYVGGSADDVAWSFIRAAYTSVADLAIVPMQDVLGLGAEARMNVPGVAHGNWGWRLPDGALSEETAARLRRLAEVSGRVGPKA